MHQRHHQLGALIAQTGRQWRQTLDKQLQPFGLTQATWLPLWHLAQADEPMRQKDLAALLAVDGSAVVRILDTLEKQQLIERREGTDRRAKTLHLTDKGEQVTQKLTEVVQALRQKVLAPLDEQEMDTTINVLQTVLASLEAEAAQE